MLRGLAWTFVAVSTACSGPRFSSDDCGDANCAGRSSGGAAGTGGSSVGGANVGGAGGSTTGGSTTGGSPAGASSVGGGTGGSSGGTGAGGSGAGGTDTGGGTAGSAGASSSDFPRYGVLDAFAREGPELGIDWIGGPDAYAIESQAMTCRADFCPGVFWSNVFGVTQEVFATLVSFSTESLEINLVMKAQADTNCDLLELLYSPARERLSVEACWDDQWQAFGFVDITLVPGDQLGGRIGADGFVDLFRNGIPIGRFDANDFPFIGEEGRIGVNGLVANSDEPDVWDDFGGGGE